jgi:hypothetical protein
MRILHVLVYNEQNCSSQNWQARAEGQRLVIYIIPERYGYKPLAGTAGIPTSFIAGSEIIDQCPGCGELMARARIVSEIVF